MLPFVKGGSRFLDAKKNSELYREKGENRLLQETELREHGILHDKGPMSGLPLVQSEIVPRQKTTGRSEEQTSAIEELIGQLGSDDFDRRQAASKRLLEIGLPALPVLRRHRHAHDSEISMQVLRISRQIVRDSLDLQIQKFLDDPASSLPGWYKFQTIYGDSPSTRKTFAHLFRKRNKAIKLVDGNPESTVDELRSLLIEFEQRRSQQIKADDELVSTIVFLFATFFIPDDSGDVSSDILPAQTQLKVARIFELSRRLGMDRQHHFDLLIAKSVDVWVSSPDNNLNVMPKRLSISRTFELKSAMVPALACIEADKMPSVCRRDAIDTIAKYGDRSHLEILESMLTDTTLVDRRTRANSGGLDETFTTQIRDCALAALLRITNLDYVEFGFDLGQRKQAPLILPYTLAGFADDEKREQAIARWHRLQATNTNKHP